ncbi:hypothetical protein [Sphingorhabdus sp.]
MALEAKDFQNQAQWALVAIPAPIYFYAAGFGPGSTFHDLTEFWGA